MASSLERLTTALGDRYRVERELGAGGMATVYLAEDLKHDRKVAIKVLKPELAAVLGAERFVQEIKTTAALSHPHILPLFDSGEADGFLYYVMPYIQGETIRDRLNAAVTRQTVDGKPEGGWFPQERLDLETSLRSYTVNNAWAEGEEANKGSLAAGMLADFVIIDRDLFAIPGPELKDAKVILTVVGGRVTHAAAPFER